MSKLPLGRGVTTYQREIYDEHGGFDNEVLQELEVGVGSLVTFLFRQESNGPLALLMKK